MPRCGKPWNGCSKPSNLLARWLESAASNLPCSGRRCSTAAGDPRRWTESEAGWHEDHGYRWQAPGCASRYTRPTSPCWSGGWSPGPRRDRRSRPSPGAAARHCATRISCAGLPRAPGSTPGCCDFRDRQLVAGAEAGSTVETFALGGGETLRSPDFMRRIASGAGVDARLLRLPAWLIVPVLRVAHRLGRFRSVTPAMVARQRMDLVVDDTAARQRLGWNPRPFRP